MHIAYGVAEVLKHYIHIAYGPKKLSRGYMQCGYGAAKVLKHYMHVACGVEKFPRGYIHVAYGVKNSPQGYMHIAYGVAKVQKHHMNGGLGCFELRKTGTAVVSGLSIFGNHQARVVSGLRNSTSKGVPFDLVMRRPNFSWAGLIRRNSLWAPITSGSGWADRFVARPSRNPIFVSRRFRSLPARIALSNSLGFAFRHRA